MIYFCQHLSIMRIMALRIDVIFTVLQANATTCLGNYSKMFGFQPIEIEQQQAEAYGRSDGLYAKIKKSFGTMEKCSEGEVVNMVQQCRALSSR